MEKKPSGLIDAGLSALRWNYLGWVARTFSGLAVSVVLARILGPEPFGQISIALLVISVGYLVTDLGLGSSLIKAPTLDETDIQFVFSIQILIGILAAALVWTQASWIAMFFGDSSVEQIIKSLSPLFVIQSWGQTASNLLVRNLQFGALQKAQILSYLIGFIGVGIPLAYGGLGVWSLVIANLVQVSVKTVIVFVQAKQPLRFRLKPGPTPLLGFSMAISGTNIVRWITDNWVSIIVGRSFGVTALGVFNRSFTLLYAPVSGISMTLQNVMFPIYSRVQDQRSKAREVFLASLSLLSLASFPLFMSLALVPNTLVLAVYGSAWQAAVPLLPPLALAMPMVVLSAASTPLIWAFGSVTKELRIQAVTAAVSIIIVGFASQVSLQWVAWMVLATYTVRFLLLSRECIRVFEVPKRELWTTLKGSVILTVAVSPISLLVDRALNQLQLWSLLHLALTSMVSFLAASCFLVLLPHIFLSPEAKTKISEIAAHVPTRIGNLLNLWIRNDSPNARSAHS